MEFSWDIGFRRIVWRKLEDPTAWNTEFFLKTHGNERRRVEDSAGKVFGFVQKRKIVDYNSSTSLSSFENLKISTGVNRRW